MQVTATLPAEVVTLTAEGSDLDRATASNLAEFWFRRSQAMKRK